MTYERRKQVSQDHLENPKLGDYWEEHLCPVCVVIAVDDGSVVVLTKTKAVDEGHWAWDLDAERKVCSREEFKTWLRYGSNNDTWALVVPERMKGVLDKIKVTAADAVRAKIAAKQVEMDALQKELEEVESA